MKFYFEKRVLVGFFSAITLLIILGIFSFRSIRQLIQVAAWHQHNLSITSNSDRALKSVLDIESAGRGYIISKNKAFLNDIHDALQPLDHAMQQLDSLTASDSIQHTRVDSLHYLIIEKKAWSDKVLSAREQSFEAAVTLVAEGNGRRITNEIRNSIRQLQQHERETFRKRTTINIDSLRQFQLSFVSLVICSIVIIFYLFYFINKTSKEKNEAEEKLRQASTAVKHDLEAKVEAKDQKLEELDYLYKSLASNIPGTAITILDKDERYLLAEGDLLPKLGYIKDNMPGKKISEVITPRNYEYYEGLIQRAFAGETILVERQTLSGYYTLMKVVPLKKNDDKIFAIMFVLIDVTEIKIAQFKLSELNNELEAKISDRTQQLIELNKELEAFTYSVSHDLRAPLRAISGYAQMIKEDYANILGEDGNRITQLITANALRMGKLIDDLLTFSRLGRKEVSRVKIDMESLVKEVISELTINLGSRNLNINTLPLERATGDASMIKQVWVNLISNALKYTGKKEVADIEIGSYKENDTLTYYISDNGAGFDMQYASKLFGVFQRLHKMTDFEGTGVGLALVSTIIKKHGGRIWAEAKPQQGAKFYFTIPTNNHE